MTSGTINGSHFIGNAISHEMLVPGDASQSRTGPGGSTKARSSSCFDLVDFVFPKAEGSSILKSLYHALGHASHEEVSLFPTITKTVIRDMKEWVPRVLNLL
ncbi:hypothetical protein AMTR_s00008p00209540 [Amborella trichopoda]|uniref:Uncharacterized protein n=1 Tax=Amborella trichopoda TaxID=13333 RepID=W1NIU1_AMBTC|nr:hypothetical protein AMTR_s00008p00209540 [Amborella trichopoda]